MPSIHQKPLILLIYALLLTGFNCFLSARLCSAENNTTQSPSVVQYVKMSKDRLATEDIPGALQNARAAVALDPAYPDAWKQLGRVLMIEGEYQEAVLSLARAQDMKPEDEQVRAWSLRAQVMAALKSGRIGNAKSILETILKSNPGNDEARRLLANVYAMEAAGSDSAEAEQILAKIVALEPGRSGSWRDLGWVLMTKNKIPEAIDAFNHALLDTNVDRRRLIEQVVATLAEREQIDAAKLFYTKWEPKRSFLDLGLTYIERNRLLAARAILAVAWERKEEPFLSGLYLAYARAKTGSCSDISSVILPPERQGEYMKNDRYMDVFLTIAKTCSNDNELLSSITGLERFISSAPPQSKVQIVDIFEKAGNEYRASKRDATAIDLYTTALKHDPDRFNIWFPLYSMGKGTEKEGQILSFLKDILSRTSSTAVKEGLHGLMAEKNGKMEEAIAHYLKSVADKPNQPDLRYHLFNALVEARDIAGAEAQYFWFRDQLGSGNTDVKTYVAGSLSALGRIEEALTIWQEVYLESPENPAAAIETARCMFLLCRANEAVNILHSLNAIKPDVKAYELLAEIEYDLGKMQEAYDAARAGLEIKTTDTLLRISAETAENTGDYEAALHYASQLVKSDRGNINAALIIGRSLMNLKRFNEAQAHYEKLLRRNPEFLPGIVQLRHAASSGKKPEDALRYAETFTKQRPWDLHGRQDLALSEAESEAFVPALKSLRRLADLHPSMMTGVLIYSQVTRCPYPGRMTAKKVTAHLKGLASAGFRFITPNDLKRPEQSSPGVIVIVTGREPQALDEIDKTLALVGGNAIYAGDTESFKRAMPFQPPPEMLQKMAKSGRWIIGSTAARASGIKPIAQDGTRGNILTHRIMVDGTMETPSVMGNRIDSFMSVDSSALDNNRPKILLYPRGDYGQISLDTGPDATKQLRNSISKHFSYAVSTDDYGFVWELQDHLRLTGKIIPPGWDVKDLEKHLATNNPVVRSRLELAKVYSWQSQHERANVWYRNAYSSGADREETHFHWGANTDIEDDRPTAEKHLFEATLLDPASERNKKGFARADKKMHPFIDFYNTGWQDNDDRQYLSWNAYGEAYATCNLKFYAFTDWNKWSRTGLGSERGVRYGFGAKWFFREEQWVDGRLWYMNIPSVGNHVGGEASIHFPNPRWGGYMDVIGGRRQIDTVEAVQEKILANYLALRTYSRVKDVWDLFVNITGTYRTDENRTVMIDGIFMRRLHEWPFYGLGYRFRFADSKENPAEYWAPMGLQQHQLYGATRGEYGRLHYVLSGEAGAADDYESAWRFVWGIRAELEYHITESLLLHGLYTHQETPSYRNDGWNLGVSYRF